MPNQWFRMYHEFATDPKIQMLSEVDQRRFLMILCLRCSNGCVTLQTKDVTLQDEEVTFQLRITREEFDKTKHNLISRGMIDEWCNPTNWDKRQFVSDTSNDRVKRFRQKKKRYSNVTSNADVTKCNALDTDTDTDNKKEIIKEKKNDRKRKLPDDFLVTIEHREFAIEKGLPDPDGEIDAFRDYWISTGKLKVDWNATFRNWLRNARKFNPRGGSYGNSSTGIAKGKSKSHELWTELATDLVRGTEHEHLYPDKG